MKEVVFPDAGNASPNEPIVLLSKAQVLKLINQHHKNNSTKLTDEMKQWFISEANKHGWTDSNFHGMQCLLIKHFK